jgi:hypothetical protein
MSDHDFEALPQSRAFVASDYHEAYVHWHSFFLLISIISPAKTIKNRSTEAQMQSL